jgi:hypothetical protein
MGSCVIRSMKLSDDQVAEIKQRLEGGEDVYQAELAVEYRCSQALISNIATGKRRAHVKSAGPASQGRIDAEGRECTGPCGLYKPWSEFSPNPRAKLTGHQSACKECRNGKSQEVVAAQRQGSYVRQRSHPRAVEDHRLAVRSWYLRRKYGISLEQYAWLSERQDHKCALCGQPETARRRQDRHGIVRVVDLLGVDHDHSCKRHAPDKACIWCIRGLLCDDCNRLLGFAERKPAVAVRFVDYLGLRPLLGEGVVLVDGSR